MKEESEQYDEYSEEKEEILFVYNLDDRSSRDSY